MEYILLGLAGVCVHIHNIPVSRKTIKGYYQTLKLFNKLEASMSQVEVE